MASTFTGKERIMKTLFDVTAINGKTDPSACRSWTGLPRASYNQLRQLG